LQHHWVPRQRWRRQHHSSPWYGEEKKAAVGRHVTKNVRHARISSESARTRIWVPELKKFVRIRVTAARGLKTINKHGAYRALKKAGVVAVRAFRESGGRLGAMQLTL